MRSAVVEGSLSLPKRPELDTEQDESSNEEEVESTSIQSFDTALMLAKDLLLFLEDKGEEAAAENQQKVISALQDAKLRRPTKQSSLYEFANES